MVGRGDRDHAGAIGEGDQADAESRRQPGDEVGSVGLGCGEPARSDLVDFIEADMSTTRITVPVVTGTFTMRSGRATPSTSRA